jgi:hypothetical protein
MMSSKFYVIVVETDGNATKHQANVQAKLDLFDEHDEIFDIGYSFARKPGEKQKHSTQIVYRRYSGEA